MGVSLSLASIVSDDIVGLSTFYAEVFDLAEVEELRSDIFRGLDLAGVTLGFSTPVVYDMLKIEPWRDARGTKQYLTFEAEDDAGAIALAKGHVGWQPLELWCHGRKVQRFEAASFSPP